MRGLPLQDRYEIVREIGHGGMGTVYEARARGSGERVAIKWLHARPIGPDDPDLLRFTQEARIAGSVDSPHVTRVLELARDPETQVPFLVMELLRGEDVRSLIERVGPLRPEVALRVAAQACEGLAAAHAAGVIHRDIKPENLFLSEGQDGAVVVKLLDFGVAKIRRTAEHAGASGGLTAPLIPMTQSGQVVGTPLFMAPEQIEGAKHVDARSDVYSMGVTLYTMLAGAAPHSRIKSLVQLLYSLVNEPPPPLGEAAPWVSAEIAGVVDKAMTKEKEGRYASAAEMLGALRALLGEEEALRVEMLVGVDEEQRKAASGGRRGADQTTVIKPGTASAPEPARAQAPAARRAALWAAAALVVVAVIVIAAVWGR